MNRTLLSPYFTSQVLKFKPTGLFFIGMNESVYRLNSQKRDALPVRRILYVAHLIRKLQRMLQNATTSLQNRTGVCVAAGGGIIENLLKAQVKYKFKLHLDFKFITSCVDYFLPSP
jgi:hypothetical protein